jgi:hypothetical protein
MGFMFVLAGHPKMGTTKAFLGRSQSGKGVPKWTFREVLGNIY